MPVDLETTARIQRLSSFRGEAIGAYSELEQVLCSLFQNLLGVEPNKAGIIFWRITNTNARNVIFEKLIREEYQDTYNLFLNDALKLLRQIDQRRNEIVHWSILPVTDEMNVTTVALIPPNFWSFSHDSSPSIGEAEMTEFKEKCTTLSNLIVKFLFYVCWYRHDMAEDMSVVLAWRNIFQQGLVYPLPLDHLLFQSQQKS